MPLGLLHSGPLMGVAAFCDLSIDFLIIILLSGTIDPYVCGNGWSILISFQVLLTYTLRFYSQTISLILFNMDNLKIFQNLLVLLPCKLTTLYLNMFFVLIFY